MTNREVLARKSNEELARLLFNRCFLCKYSQQLHCDGKCVENIQQWLEQEAKDEKGKV